VRRHRAIAAVTVGFLVLTVVGLAAGLAVLNAQNRELRRQQSLVESQRAAAAEYARAVRLQLYAAEMAQAHRAWLRADVEECRSLIERWRATPGEEDLRGFEWHYLEGLCREARTTTARVVTGHRGDVYRVA